MAQPLQDEQLRLKITQQLDRLREQAEAGMEMPACERSTEFYGICGHFVYSQHCNDPCKIYADDELQDTATCCDESCAVNDNAPILLPDMLCLWCRAFPDQPETTSTRSDGGLPGLARLSRDEIERRRTEQQQLRRARLHDPEREPRLYVTIPKASDQLNRPHRSGSMSYGGSHLGTGVSLWAKAMMIHHSSRQSLVRPRSWETDAARYAKRMGTSNWHRNSQAASSFHVRTPFIETALSHG
jgi:hypothetical protein